LLENRVEHQAEFEPHPMNGGLHQKNSASCGEPPVCQTSVSDLSQDRSGGHLAARPPLRA
jgi:hypothetical protein